MSRSGEAYAQELNRKRVANQRAAAAEDNDENKGNGNKVAFGAAGNFDTVSEF